MNSTLMYYTILESVFNYRSVGIKISHVHREYITNFLRFTSRFYEPQDILLTFFQAHSKSFLHFVFLWDSNNKSLHPAHLHIVCHF